MSGGEVGDVSLLVGPLGPVLTGRDHARNFSVAKLIKLLLSLVRSSAEYAARSELRGLFVPVTPVTSF